MQIKTKWDITHLTEWLETLAVLSTEENTEQWELSYFDGESENGSYFEKEFDGFL